MKIKQAKVLATTPFLISAMATSALAQEVTNATPSQTVQAVAEVSAPAAEVVIPLKISVPTSGTYVFMSPADNQVTIALDGTIIMDATDSAASTDGAPFKVITSLAAGDHLVEIIQRHLVDCRRGAEHTGIVENSIQAARLGHKLGEHARYSFSVRHISGQCDGTPMRAGHLLKDILATCNKAHLPTGGQKFLRARTPNARTGAGDQN